MSTRVRSAGIDAVRIFGILAVIFGHVYAGNTTNQWIYSWHVPLFFVITGYLWSPGRTVRREATSRWRTLGLPYIGWFVVALAFLLFDMSRSGPISWDVVLHEVWGGALSGGPFGTFWFVSVLFFAAVLFRVVERLPVTVQWTIAAVGLLVSYLFGSWLASTPLGVAMALPCLVFLLAGRALRQVEPRITRPGLVGGGLLAVSAVAIAVLPLQFVDLKHGSFGTPIVGVLVAVAVASGFLLVAQRVRYAPSVARGIVALAAVGIAVVLSHPIVILAVKALGFPNKGSSWLPSSSRGRSPWCFRTHRSHRS